MTIAPAIATTARFDSPDAHGATAMSPFAPLAATEHQAENDNFAD